MLCLVLDNNLVSHSMSSDGETFISADDLRINLWNLEISDQCFNIIDMKPSNMEDLTGTYSFSFWFFWWASVFIFSGIC